ncbi:hypothetical protein ZWY2020_004556 [Hordeum vulgare]|nr:hypothetical protein ZWY2020_004556 [Hordeum vulgare]
MAAVAGPTVLRLRPRAASLSAPAVSASPRCRLSSVAYSYPKLAGSFAVQRVNGSRMQYVDTLKEQVLRNSSNHDGHIKRIVSCTASDKQEPTASLTSDTPVLEDTKSSTADSSERWKAGFISFHGGSSQTISVESVPHPGKEASRLVWFVGPTILVAFLVLPSLYLRKVLSAVFEDSLLTDFLILFFTEALFYGGVGIFVLLIDKVWRPLQQLQLLLHLIW